MGNILQRLTSWWRNTEDREPRTILQDRWNSIHREICEILQTDVNDHQLYCLKNAAEHSESITKYLKESFVPRNTLDNWQERISAWYPNRHTATNFLPPLFIHQETIVEKTMFPIPVYQASSSSEHDEEMQGSTAQQLVLRELRNLTDDLKEPMMIISELQFGTYFHAASYTPATECFLKGKDIPLPERQEGDFDILIIHPKHGIIIGEIKSIGAKQKCEDIIQAGIARLEKALYQLKIPKETIRGIVIESEKQKFDNIIQAGIEKELYQLKIPKKTIRIVTESTKQEFDNIIQASVEKALYQLKIPETIRGIVIESEKQEFDNIIQARIEKALYQLNKSEELIRHIVIDPKTVVIKTICLPYITSEEFMRAVAASVHLLEKLRETLETDDPEKMCLLKDTPIQEWWRQLTSSRDHMEPMTNEQYDNNLIRFCGPAITVNHHFVTPPRLELRTAGDAISETGNRIAIFKLLESQIQLIKSPVDQKPMVFLTGPPGTGKTIVLLYKTLELLRQGHKVHLVSSWYKSLPSMLLIKHHIELKIPNPNIDFHNYNFEMENDHVDQAVSKLMNDLDKRENLFVIVDEAGPDLREDALRMFPYDKKKWYTYKKPMTKEEALRQLQEHLSFNQADAEQIFTENSTDEGLDLDSLHRFYVEYTEAYRLRQKLAITIFGKCALTEKSLHKHEAQLMLEDIFSIDSKDAAAKFDALEKEREEILTLQDFRKCYHESEPFLQYRIEHAHNIFMTLKTMIFKELKGNDEKEWTLQKSDAIVMLKSKLSFTDDEVEKEFIMKEYLDQTHFQRIYFTHPKANELRRKHISTLVANQKFDKTKMLQEIFSLPSEQACVMYQEILNENKQFSEVSFQQFYFTSEEECLKLHREEHAKQLFWLFINYYGKHLKKSEMIEEMPKLSKAIVSEEEVQLVLPALESANSYIDDEEFTGLYESNPSLKEYLSKRRFEEYLKKYKRSISKQSFLSAMKEKYDLDLETCFLQFEDTITSLQFQKFFAHNKEASEWRKLTATRIYADDTGQIKKDSKKHFLKLFQEHFTLSKKEAKIEFNKIRNKCKRSLTVEEFQKYINRYECGERLRINAFSKFCDELVEKVPKLFLWAAAIERHTKPICLTEEVLTVPLRSTSNIHEEVSLSDQIDGKFIHKYTNLKGIAVIDGPKPIRRSYNHHKEKQLQDCEECGKEIVKVLTDLNVGAGGIRPLEFRDVLVLCDNPFDDSIQKNKRASGLVRGLRTKYDVRVVRRFTNEEPILETIIASSNKVTVSHYRHAHGLERKVVVVVGNPEVYNDFSRLYNMSRAISQLVLIEHK